MYILPQSKFFKKNSGSQNVKFVSSHNDLQWKIFRAGHFNTRSVLSRHVPEEVCLTHTSQMLVPPCSSRGPGPRRPRVSGLWSQEYSSINHVCLINTFIFDVFWDVKRARKRWLQKWELEIISILFSVAKKKLALQKKKTCFTRGKSL